MSTQNHTVKTPGDELNPSPEGLGLGESPCSTHPCHDCGKPTTAPLLMNVNVAGDFQYLCPDCKEDNDPDDVMQEPCPRCHGSGLEWEGWNCEYCDGYGTADF